MAGVVEAEETFVLSSRKGERNLGRKPRKRGGKAAKRGLSHELTPILVAVDRTGVTISAVLPSISAASLQAVLEPVLSKDALLVTDGCTSYPPCAAALGVSHMALRLSAGERVRGDRNYPPPGLRDQAETAPRMVLKGLAPDSRAVSTVVRRSASASAAHLAR